MKHAAIILAGLALAAAGVLPGAADPGPYPPGCSQETRRELAKLEEEHFRKTDEIARKFEEEIGKARAKFRAEARKAEGEAKYHEAAIEFRKKLAEAHGEYGKKLDEENARFDKKRAEILSKGGRGCR
jgi:hypothetical protein